MLPQNNLMANAMPSYTVILLSNKITDADARLVSGDLIKVSDVNKIIFGALHAHFISPKYLFKKKIVDVFVN